MISNPRAGWCTFRLIDFEETFVSYLTDVPLDLADAFLDLFEQERATVAVSFDTEGTEFDLIMGYNGVYIVNFADEKPKVIELKKFYGGIFELSQEFLRDIENEGVKNWVAKFLLYADENEFESKCNLLENKIQRLKAVLAQRSKKI